MDIHPSLLASAAAWQYHFGRRAKRLHQGQIDFAEHPAKEKTGCWGRRGGKSLILGENMIPRFALAHPETEGMIVSRTQMQANLIFDYLVGVVMNGPLLSTVQECKRAPYPLLVFKNDARWTARNAGYGGKNIRGNNPDVVVNDEAAFIEDAVIENAIRPSLAASPHALMWNISTPNGLNWFHEAYMRGQPGHEAYDPRRAWSLRIPSWRNPFVSLDFLRAARLRMTPMAFACEYGAIFHENEGAEFPWSLIQSILDSSIDELGLRKPARRYVIGYDPADVIDRSAVVVLDCSELPWRVVDAQDIKGMGFPKQKEVVVRLSRRYNNAQVLVDETNNKALRQELAVVLGGHRVEGYTFTNQSKIELIEGLRILMEQADLLIPDLPDGPAMDLITELKYYRRAVTKSGAVQLGAAENQHDDFVTALALAAWNAKNKPRVGKVELL